MRPHNHLIANRSGACTVEPLDQAGSPAGGAGHGRGLRLPAAEHIANVGGYRLSR